MDCIRCGQCCKEVGRTFWKNGFFIGCEGLNTRADDGDHEDGDLPCEMLSFDKDGKAVCGIQSIYGYKWKPRVCREYPEDEELCFREKELSSVDG